MSGYSSAAEAAERIMPWPATHYGCRVIELGDDGDEYAVSAHVPERRAKAAVLHYLRRECDYSRFEVFDREWLADVLDASIDHLWAAPTGNENEPWEWCDAFREGSEPVTLVSLR